MNYKIFRLVANSYEQYYFRFHTCLERVLKDTPSDIAHGGDHASSYNGGNLPSGSAVCLCQGTCPPQLLHRNGLASQDRARSLNQQRHRSNNKFFYEALQEHQLVNIRLREIVGFKQKQNYSYSN
ncbi:MAG: hypothetical protein ACRC2S_22540 [Waterburya sp.]